MILENENLRTIIEAIPQLVWRCNPDGSADYAADRFLHHVGRSREQVLGWGWLSLIHPDDQERVGAEWARCRAAAEAVSVDFRLRVGTGYRWTRSEGNPFFNDQGELTKYYGTWTDIHERVRAERATENERNNFRNLFRQTPEMVCILSGPDHVFEFTNAAHVRALGFDATGMRVREAQPESVEVFEILDEVYRTGVTAPLVEKPITLGDSLRYFNLTYAARWDDEGRVNGVMILGAEITEQVRARQEVERLAASLRDAVSARDEFLSIASHELKTPLTSLKLQAQSFERAVNRGDPRISSPEWVGRFTQQTDRQVSRLNRLVDDMLDVARIRARKLTLEPETVDLRDLLTDVTERLRPQFLAANYPEPLLELRGDVAGRWDRVRLEQVVTNLFTNAIRYGRGRPVTIVGGPNPSGRGGARIEVRDQGIGIAPHAREVIFNRFERAIDASEVSGLGLGLFISKQIVLAHGGKIWVESEVGEGSTFVVELPDAIPAE